jgi:mRNA interferase YafQ
MFTLTTTKQFDKDYKLCKKRGCKMILLNSLFFHLEKDGIVPAKNKPHKLSGILGMPYSTRLVVDLVL